MVVMKQQIIVSLWGCVLGWLCVCCCEVTGECGLCIPSQWRCDGDIHADCSDDGDETTNYGRPVLCGCVCICLSVCLSVWLAVCVCEVTGECGLCIPDVMGTSVMETNWVCVWGGVGVGYVFMFLSV